MKIKILYEKEWDEVRLDELEKKYGKRMLCDLYYEMDIFLGERVEVEKELGVKGLKEYEDECGMLMFGWYEGKVFVVYEIFKEISEKIDRMSKEVIE